MKHFLPFFILFLSIFSFVSARDNIYTVKGKTNVSIYMKGIEKPMKVLQITDSHISGEMPSDPQLAAYSKRMHNAYPMVKHFQSGEMVSPKDMFKELMKLAVDEKVDLIVLTGDIVNYPGESGIEFVLNEIKKTSIPFIYTAGNHDWHYEGMPGNAMAQNREWTNKSLKPLYEGKNPAYSSTVINGINFIAIDNSTYQVDDEQLNFFMEQKKRKLPIVLMMHIPVDTKGTWGMGNPDWGPETDQNYKVEARERWTSNLPSTVKFKEEILNMKDIVLLTGHHHENQIDIEGGVVQFITQAATGKAHRIFNFIPLEK